MNSFTSSMSGNSVCFGRCFCVLDVLLCFYLRFLRCCLCICVLDVFASTAPQYRVCGERVPKVSQGAPTTNHRTNHLDFHQSEYTLPEIWSVIEAVNFFECVCFWSKFKVRATFYCLSFEWMENNSKTKGGNMFWHFTFMYPWVAKTYLLHML